MFSKIKNLELEFHSQCNRKCEWCPNKDIDRTFYKELDEDVFLKLLNDLKINKFNLYRNATVYIARYHEPLINIGLLNKRIKQIKKFFPYINIVVKTNGDFVEKLDLKDFYATRLNIMDYDCLGAEKVKKKISEAGFKNIKYNKKNKQILSKSKYGTTALYRVDWPKHALLENRGGLLSQEEVIHNRTKLKWRKNREERTEICTEPLDSIYIDYNGSVMPCAHTRSDADSHKELILGNLYKSDIDDIYKSSRTKKILAKFSNKNSMPQACNNCHRNTDGKSHASSVNGLVF